MSDIDNIDRYVNSLGSCPVISHAAARTIAAAFHSGQNSLGYRFVSTGAIPEDPVTLWRDLFPEDEWHDMPELDRCNAQHLGIYLLVYCGRGPVFGWHNYWL